MTIRLKAISRERREVFDQANALAVAIVRAIDLVDQIELDFYLRVGKLNLLKMLSHVWKTICLTW